MNRNCVEVQASLSAWFDGELPDEVGDVIQAHLAECLECRSIIESLQRLDATIAKAGVDSQRAGQHISDNVIGALLQGNSREMSTGGVPTKDSTRAPTIVTQANTMSAVSWRNLASLSAAAAAGFLVAWLIFAPSRRGSVESVRSESPPSVAPTGPSEDASPRAEPTLARMVVATGDVEWRQPGQTAWSVVEDVASFRCAEGTEVRTGAGVRCELVTDERCTVRLNESTELAVRSPREIELRAGQVWCSSTSDGELNIVAASFRSVEPQSPAIPLRFTCPAHGSLISEIDGVGSCRVQGSNGEIAVNLGAEKHRLQHGQIARFEKGQLVIEPHHGDSLLSTSWMQPLLVLKGHDSPELGERVNRLLANLGRSKLDNLYEDEIRSLGDYAVLPLLRFVQSDTSQAEPAQRQRAMTIVADIAPSWLIGDLIELLTDAEPAVRIAAAQALERLTRQNQGREPRRWSAPPAELQESAQRWRNWWRKNSHRYEQRPVGRNKSAQTS